MVILKEFLSYIWYEKYTLRKMLKLNGFDSGFNRNVQYDSENRSSKNRTKIFTWRKMRVFFPEAILRQIEVIPYNVKYLTFCLPKVGTSNSLSVLYI